MKQRIRINENQLRKIVTESVKSVLKESTGTPNKNTRDVVHQLKTDQPWNPYKTINKDVVRGEGRNEDRIRVALNDVEETVEDLSIKIEDFEKLNSFAYGKDGGWYGEHENNKPGANLRNYTAKMRKAVNLLRTVISMAKKKVIMNLGEQPFQYPDRYKAFPYQNNYTDN